MILALMALAVAGSTATVPADSIDTREVGPGHPLAATYAPADLVDVPVPPATREGLRLRAPAWDALQTMLTAARQEGIELRVVSAYRPFAYQTSIYDRAVERFGADQRWVARPGESEHQLGTTVDLADAALQHVLEPTFGGTAEGQWLATHCERFGFRITYTAVTAEAMGIRPEPWHVRYLGRGHARP